MYFSFDASNVAEMQHYDYAVESINITSMLVALAVSPKRYS